MAVLPFQPAAGDTAQQYLADGLRDELVAVLSRLQELDVVAQRSADRLDSASRDVQAAGRALRVNSVMTGTVQTSGFSAAYCATPSAAYTRGATSVL